MLASGCRSGAPLPPKLNLYINGLCGEIRVWHRLCGVYGETREEHEDMPELQACKRSLPSALPVLASLVSLSLGLTAISSVRAHQAPPAFAQIGTASWYGPRFHGKKTANGEAFNQNKLTAAHRTLPLGTRVEVTNVTNGKSVEVKITDRGPYVNGRVIDLSRAAAIRLGMKDAGLARVQIVALTGNYRST
jgi:rare lipoprotein A